MVDHTIRTILTLRPQDGAEAELEALVRDAVALAKAEPGTIDHIWWHGPKDGRVTLTEQFADSHAAVNLLRGEFGTRILPNMLRIAPVESLDLFGPVSAELFEAVKGMAPRVGKPIAAFRRSRLDQAIDRHEAINGRQADIVKEVDE